LFSEKEKKSGLICNREPFLRHFQKSSDNTAKNRVFEWPLSQLPETLYFMELKSLVAHITVAIY